MQLPLSMAQTYLPKQAMNVVLYYLVKQWIADSNCGTLPYRERQSSFMFQHYKAFTMKNRIVLVSPQGKALCLLKTQFAKKPKNPV